MYIIDSQRFMIFQTRSGLYANQKHLINVVYDQVYEKEENNNGIP